MISYVDACLFVFEDQLGIGDWAADDWASVTLLRKEMNTGTGHIEV
jgi:hypothetical protein